MYIYIFVEHMQDACLVYMGYAVKHSLHVLCVQSLSNKSAGPAGWHQQSRKKQKRDIPGAHIRDIYHNKISINDPRKLSTRATHACLSVIHVILFFTY